MRVSSTGVRDYLGQQVESPMKASFLVVALLVLLVTLCLNAEARKLNFDDLTETHKAGILEALGRAMETGKDPLDIIRLGLEFDTKDKKSTSYGRSLDTLEPKGQQEKQTNKSVSSDSNTKDVNSEVKSAAAVASPDATTSVTKPIIEISHEPSSPVKTIQESSSQNDSKPIASAQQSQSQSQSQAQAQSQSSEKSVKAAPVVAAETGPVADLVSTKREKVEAPSPKPSADEKPSKESKSVESLTNAITNFMKQGDVSISSRSKSPFSALSESINASFKPKTGGTITETIEEKNFDADDDFEIPNKTMRRRKSKKVKDGFSFESVEFGSSDGFGSGHKHSFGSFGSDWPFGRHNDWAQVEKRGRRNPFSPRLPKWKHGFGEPHRGHFNRDVGSFGGLGFSGGQDRFGFHNDFQERRPNRRFHGRHRPSHGRSLDLTEESE